MCRVEVLPPIPRVHSHTDPDAYVCIRLMKSKNATNHDHTIFNNSCPDSGASGRRLAHLPWQGFGCYCSASRELMGEEEARQRESSYQWRSPLLPQLRVGEDVCALYLYVADSGLKL